MNAPKLVAQLSPPLDSELLTALVEEFVSLERRYVLCDWEPATLDGGQFVEIAARAVYHSDSGNLNKRKSLDACCKYIEDPNNSNQHGFPGRRTALHLCRVIRTVYKFRSQRGAVHIDPDYTANELDTSMIMANVRWIMSEILRVFWTGAKSEVAQAIREIIRFDVPAVLKIDERYLVLRVDCTTEEEILILLHNAGEAGMARDELGKSIPKSAPSVTNSLKALMSAERREVVPRADQRYMLTPRGSKRVREELAAKLTLQ
ncbi:MAG: hypothetical protein O7D91_19350 [Planctomycetota bacterium]|nr:hypothetical protein [Planctomycetota bacterium]